MPSLPKTQFDELIAWMEQNGFTFRRLSELSGLDKMTLNRLANGSFKQFNRGVIPAIEKATQGAIGEPEFIAFLGRLAGKQAAE